MDRVQQVDYDDDEDEDDLQPRRLKRRSAAKLKVLIRFMRRLPRTANRHFNMGSFFSHGGTLEEYDAIRGGKVTRRVLTQCGTTACALGWASVVPEFQRAGLWMDVQEEFHIGRREYGPIEAATEFFDIDEKHGTLLFGAVSRIATPQAWANYAEALIKVWGVNPARRKPREARRETTRRVQKIVARPDAKGPTLTPATEKAEKPLF